MKLNKKFDIMINRYTIYDKIEKLLKEDKTAFNYEIETIRELKNKVKDSITEYLNEQDPSDIYDLFEESLNKLEEVLKTYNA